MVKCVQLVGRLRDRATALFGGKVRIRIVVATVRISASDSTELTEKRPRITLIIPLSIKDKGHYVPISEEALGVSCPLKEQL